MLSPRLHNYLDQQHSNYSALVHERTVTAHETASAAHVSRQLFAKTVMLKVDGTLAMIVMPAAYRVDLTRLSRALGGRMVELAEEHEFKDAFPDCEVGAMSPFGNLYGIPVFVDSRLAQQAKTGLAIEFPVKAGGTRTAVFETGGADKSRLPKWR